MIIEAMLYLAVVTAAGAAIAKVYELRQDVLYGPYLNLSVRRPNDRQIITTPGELAMAVRVIFVAFTVAFGLSRHLRNDSEAYIWLAGSWLGRALQPINCRTLIDIL
jgi:hypothetical protein